MRSVAVAVVAALASGAPARADTWRAGAEIAGEVDTNVNRAEEGGEGEAQAAPVVRAGGDVEGAGRAGWADWAARGGAEVRVVGDSSVIGENVAALSGELRAERDLPDRPVRVGLRASAYDVVGLGEDPARGFRWIAGEATLGLVDGARRAWLSIGARDVTYTVRGTEEDRHLDWRGPTLALGVTSAIWHGDRAADEPSSLEIDASYRLDLRGYDGTAAFSDACPPEEPPSNMCLAQVGDDRADLHHRLGAGVTYSGERIYAAEYELTVNDSSSYRETWIRHRVTLAATSALPLGLLVSARGAIQIEHYPDRLIIPDDTQAQSMASIDDDNRSSVQLLLARRLGAHWKAEARWGFWTDALADDDLPFRRHLVSLGITWTSAE